MDVVMLRLYCDADHFVSIATDGRRWVAYASSRSHHLDALLLDVDLITAECPVEDPDTGNPCAFQLHGRLSEAVISLDPAVQGTIQKLFVNDESTPFEYPDMPDTSDREAVETWLSSE